MRLKGSKKLLDSQYNQYQKIVRHVCKNCGAGCAYEKWVKNAKTGLYHRYPMSKYNFVRIVISVHIIITPDFPVSGGQTLIYFCSKCEQKYSISDSLFDIALEVMGEVMEAHFAREMRKDYIKEGIWVTWDKFENGKRFYANAQVCPEDLEKIIAGLAVGYGNANPFKIQLD